MRKIDPFFISEPSILIGYYGLLFSTWELSTSESFILNSPDILETIVLARKDVDLKVVFRAVDSDGRTIDFYFSKRRNKTAAYNFLKKAVKNNGLPVKVNIDKSGANTAGIELFNKRHNTNIEVDQIKFKNNIVEQDHRKIKRLTRSMGSFKNFASAQITIAGIEMMNMLKKGQVYTGDLFSLEYEDDFYEIARQKITNSRNFFKPKNIHS